MRSKPGSRQSSRQTNRLALQKTSFMKPLAGVHDAPKIPRGDQIVLKAYRVWGPASRNLRCPEQWPHSASLAKSPTSLCGGSMPKGPEAAAGDVAKQRATRRGSFSQERFRSLEHRKQHAASRRPPSMVAEARAKAMPQPAAFHTRGTKYLRAKASSFQRRRRRRATSERPRTFWNRRRASVMVCNLSHDS